VGSDKLDPQLRKLVGSQATGVFPVSIRLVQGARSEDLQRLSELVDDTCDLPVVTGELSTTDVMKAIDNEAVLTIRLSRRLHPAELK
jgi:hypothetical protein